MVSVCPSVYLSDQLTLSLFLFGHIIQVMIGDYSQDKGVATRDELRSEFGRPNVAFFEVDVTVPDKLDGEFCLWSDLLWCLWLLILVGNCTPIYSGESYRARLKQLRTF